MQSELSIIAKKKTWVRLYGTEHPMHDPDIFEKCMKNTYKDFIWPSGKIISYQGFEHFSYHLLLEKYLEEEMITIRKLVPTISYVFEHSKIYYPDIFIPKDNLIIEVKSTFTFDRDREKNLAKRAACIDIGYNFQFLVFDKNGDLLVEYEDM